MKSDEYITTVTFMFGTVKPGFANVETPQIFVKVLPNLQNGLEFSNKADVGGRYNGAFIISNSTTLTTVYNPQKKQQLPKTGY